MPDSSAIPKIVKNQPWSVCLYSEKHGGEWFNYENFDEAIAGLNRLVVDCAVHCVDEMSDRDFTICPTADINDDEEEP